MAHLDRGWRDQTKVRPRAVWSARALAAGWVVCRLPAIAYASHPAGRIHIWIGLLVFALAFSAAWLVFALIDRLRTPRSRGKPEQAGGNPP